MGGRGPHSDWQEPAAYMAMCTSEAPVAEEILPPVFGLIRALVALPRGQDLPTTRSGSDAGSSHGTSIMLVSTYSQGPRGPDARRSDEAGRECCVFVEKTRHFKSVGFLSFFLAPAWTTVGEFFSPPLLPLQP